jgi:ClpX C4-type zinc finger
MPTATVTTSQCSFCLEDEGQIAQIIAGPGVFICNECVDRCTQILKDGPVTDGRAELPYWESMDDTQLVAQLPRIASVATQVEDNLHTWVRRTRDRGVSWARIGQALGTSRQSAWERFSGEE